MKSLHLVILIVSSVAIAALIFSMYENWFEIGQPGHMQKLSDIYRIRTIYNPNDTGSDSGVSLGYFAWSQDGKFAVFAFGNANPDGSTLWTISRDGQKLQEIPIKMKFDVINKIRIVSDDIFFDGWYNGQNNQDVFKYDMKNQALTKLTKSGNVNVFDVMPDGNIVYQEEHNYQTKVCPLKVNDTSGNDWAGYYTELWIADQRDNKIKSIYNGTEVFQEIDLSPDGKYIAFTDMTHPLNPKLHAMIVCSPFGGPPFANIQIGLKLLDVNSGSITTIDTSTTGYQNLIWPHDENSILYTVQSNQCIPLDSTANSQTCSAGFIKLRNIHDGTVKLVYGRESSPYTEWPIGTAVSSDARSIIFGIDDDVNDGLVNGKGIYVFEFDKPL